MNTFICFGWYVKKHKATFFKHIPFKSTLHDFCTTLRTILLLSNKPIPESILLRFPFAYASQFFPPISTHSWKAKVKYLNTTATKGKKRKVGSSSTIGLGILCEPAPLAMLKVEFIVRFTRTHENAFRRSAVLLTSTFQLHPATTRAAHFSANIGFHWIILAFKRPTATINFLHISLILVLATTFAGFFFVSSTPRVAWTHHLDLNVDHESVVHVVDLQRAEAKSSHQSWVNKLQCINSVATGPLDASSCL